MNPVSYHPAMRVTVAGRLLRQLVEVQAITHDVQTSFGAGVLTLLLMVVAYFFYKNYQARAGRRFSARVLFSELARMPVTALILGVPLAASLAWTFGLVYLLFGTLNMMTSTLGLLLFGLGIDFGIHFYARYAEERGVGYPVVEAVERTFMTTGQAIAIVAITTAAAFYLLMFADFRGFSEFGAIAGTGLLFALVAMIVLMPAILVFFERMGLINLTTLQGAGRAAEAPEPRPAPARFAGMERRFPAPRFFVLMSLLALGVALVALPRVAFEYDYGSLEPSYEAYDALNSVPRRVYNDRRTRNAAYILVDDPAEAPAVVATLRAHAARDTLTPTIRAVESLHDRFPMTPEAQHDKLHRIAAIRTLLDDPFTAASQRRAAGRACRPDRRCAGAMPVAPCRRSASGSASRETSPRSVPTAWIISISRWIERCGPSNDGTASKRTAWSARRRGRRSTYRSRRGSASSCSTWSGCAGCPKTWSLATCSSTSPGTACRWSKAPRRCWRCA